MKVGVLRNDVIILMGSIVGVSISFVMVFVVMRSKVFVRVERGIRNL